MGLRHRSAALRAVQRRTIVAPAPEENRQGDAGDRAAPLTSRWGSGRGAPIRFSPPLRTARKAMATIAPPTLNRPGLIAAALKNPAAKAGRVSKFPALDGASELTDEEDSCRSRQQPRDHEGDEQQALVSCPDESSG